MFSGMGVMLEALIVATKPLLAQCDTEECPNLAMNSCGGKHKRFLCDRCLAVELTVHKTKESFTAARNQWSDIPQARAYSDLENYMKTVGQSSVHGTVH